MKQRFKIVTDILMTIALLLLMSYMMVGRDVHEWIGVAMFVLFIIHHILNVKWSKNLIHGKYTAYRIVQTILVVCIFVSMISSMYSGIVLSREVFTWLSLGASKSFARNLHMLGAYWGFIFMGLHLGLHWNMILAMAGKRFEKKSKARKTALRIIGALIAGYGIYALINRKIFSYMFLQQKFVFFDLSESLLLFLLDYLAILGLWVFLGHYLVKEFESQVTNWLKKTGQL